MSNRVLPGIVPLGMTADAVLRQPGRGELYIVAPTQHFGADAHGNIYGWMYADCTVILARNRPEGPFCVRQVVKHDPVLHG